MVWSFLLCNEVNPAAAKSLQSCPTLCNPIDGSPKAPPSMGFSRRVPEWVAIAFSSESAISIHMSPSS